VTAILSLPIERGEGKKKREERELSPLDHSHLREGLDIKKEKGGKKVGSPIGNSIFSIMFCVKGKKG